jgi:hypothetical protein
MVSGVSAAAGLKSDQFNQKRNFSQFSALQRTSAGYLRIASSGVRIVIP